MQPGGYVRRLSCVYTDTAPARASVNQSVRSMDNRIDATLTPEQRTAIEGAVQTIRDNLPFAVNLSPQERQELFKTGDKSIAFVQGCLDAARQFPGVLAADFDMDAFERDVALFTALGAPLMAIRDVLETADDTRMVAGVDAMDAALEVYYYVRGRPGTEQLNTLAQALGRRFARRSPSGGDSPA
jgi:hypothetical protein